MSTDLHSQPKMIVKYRHRPMCDYTLLQQLWKEPVYTVLQRTFNRISIIHFEKTKLLQGGYGIRW
jgi:hypothetical protein